VIPDDEEAGGQAGRLLGVTDWIRLPQEMLTAFETLTLSNDPLHMDPNWVAARLCLIPEGHHALNYGFDRVRWVEPVPVGAEVRARFVDGGSTARPAGRPGRIARYEVTIELRNSGRPAMVATWLGALIPDAPPAEPNG
jgi:acyl dehydratase